MLLRVWLALSVVFVGAARGQAPSYTAASLVNASNYASGPFAPNSVISLFGTNLSFSTQNLTPDMISGNRLPTQMAGVGVYMDGSLTPLLYVSPFQINFLVPVTEIPGPALVTVVRQGVAGPTVTVTLVTAAPQMFQYADNPGYVMAEDWNAGNAPITPAAPAHGGDIVVLFVTGMGVVAPATSSGEVAQFASPIVNQSSLKVWIGGMALDPSAILYAGLTPGSIGLYQIDLVLPADPGTDPPVQVSVGGQTSSAGCLLAVR